MKDLYQTLNATFTMPRPTLSRLPTRSCTYQKNVVSVSADLSHSHQRLYSVWNWNVNSLEFIEALLRSAIQLRNESLWTNVRPYTTAGVSFTPEQHAAMHSNREGSQPDQPHSFVFRPVFRSLQDNTSEAVAILTLPVAWDVPLRHALPESVNGINVVLRNTCNQSFTYLLNGPDALYIGEGDLHDTTYDDLGMSVDLWESDHPDYITVGNHCLFSLTVYPTVEFKESHESATPQIYATVIAVTFLLMIVAFVIYDLMVQRRNQKLIHNAARSNAIVTSLFPKNVRDRVVAQEGIDAADGKSTNPLKVGSRSAPIADLHLESTIMFADVVGFTAWSSVREPVQVFTLLETLYGAFDKIAEHRRVFKVETVGDCYVAATGIPTYHKDHATTMVRFAKDIMIKMSELVKKLEIRLGPDTGDLSLRIGIHSGPITAGVLRGQRSRFQLFGDTMNTTARIESSSKAGKIHISSETAEFLKKDGKGCWLEKRHDLITAKGKGSLQTYWLKSIEGKHCLGQEDRDCGSSSNTTTYPDDQSDVDLLLDVKESDLSEKIQRLIEWNTETLLTFLKQIVARRSTSRGSSNMELTLSHMEKNHFEHPLEQVQEIISLPDYDAAAVKNQKKNSQNIEVGEAIVDQIREYVTCIAKMYRKNAFHNFEHASHVTMSVTKLLSRIVAPKTIGDDHHDKLHDHTYGITSDPLTQFACAFSALIHDVDHTGVPNAQLVKENHPLTSFYNNRSVAEQYSLTLSWELLMEDRFHDFRRCLYTTETELMRFRHLVVNGVMATDIADKDLKNLRNARWAKAFDDVASTKQAKADVDRKATIVIEHLIQASDISHTMQHWHVYRKWNERLFREMYQAFLDGRADQDPRTFWYEGEMGFFDFYIIPLAKKLKECGVFGISSDEYLNYALNNREEWERRGKEVIAQMITTLSTPLVGNPGE
jgi:class 3 adenylate cyclase